MLGLLALAPAERSAALSALGEAALGAGVEGAEVLESALASLLP